MDYTKLYYILLLLLLFAMYVAWNKRKNIRYEDIEINCENCGEKINHVLENEENYEYTCKKCKHKGIVKKVSVENDAN